MTKDQILEKVRKYVQNLSKKKFIPGETYIPSTAPLIDDNDVVSLVETVLDFPEKIELEGPKTRLFDRLLREILGSEIRRVRLTNSGSSANLLAVTTITDPVFGERQAHPGDEILTVAAGFPTTINPIIQNRLVPVFFDVDLDTLTPDVELMEQAIVRGKTKGIMIAHPLGNPVDAEAIRDVADEHGIWFIEDSADALGGTLDGNPIGSFGDMSTFSFYPAHQLTGGEAGAVCIKSPMVDKVLTSFRDWGRSCWCEPGKENTCGKRFGWNIDTLPDGYDHKYIYDRIGYNLKSTEMSAALLVTQLSKLPKFVEQRVKNHNALREGLDKYKKYFRLHTKTPGSNPSWFGFLITVKEVAPFSRLEITQFLESKKIGTRLLFAGNITHQPAYKHVVYKEFQPLTNSDVIANSSFWISVSPTLTDEHLAYMISTIGEFVESRSRI